MATPIILTPGQVVAAPDWEAVFAQHGGSKSQQVRTPTKEERQRAEDANDDIDQNPIYRYYAADGSYVEARTSETGDYQIVDYKPSAQFQQGQRKSPDDPTERNAAELQRQRERNAALPADQDPAYETDEERRKRAQARIDQQGRDAKAADDKARQDALDKERRDKDAKAEAERNKPQPQQAPDGSWGYFDTSKPGQQPTWVPIQNGPGAAAPKPVQVNGQWGVWQPNATDPKQPPTFVTIDVPKPGITLKNVDTWEPDFSQPDLGLGKWAASQRQKIGLPADQGGITQKDYDDAVKEAHERGGVTVSNITSSNTVQRQRQQDEEARRSARSQESDTDFSRALGAFTGLTSKGGFDPDSGSLRNVIPGLMWEMNRSRREREGQAAPVPGLHPMFQVASAQSAATAQPPAATEQAAGTGPTPEPYTPPGQPEKPAPIFTPQPPVNLAPNAAPPTPVAPAVPAPPPGAAAPAMASPPPAPPAGAPPPMPAVTPTTSAPLPGPVEGLPAPGVPAPPAQLAPWPEQAPAQSGTDPVQPVGMTPGGGPLTAFAQQATAAPPPAPAGAPLADFAQHVQGLGEGGFDPIAEAAKLERMGVPHEVAIQALMASGVLDERTRRMMGAAA